MRNLYHINFKADNSHFDYGDLSVLFKNHTPEEVGISRYTLDRWNFEKPFENDICIIRKGVLVTSTRSK